jgi:hypothetical protein
LPRALTVFLAGVLALDDAFEVLALDVLAFGARALDVLAFGVLAFDEAAFFRAGGFGANSSSSRSSESREASSTIRSDQRNEDKPHSGYPPLRFLSTTSARDGTTTSNFRCDPDLTDDALSTFIASSSSPSDMAAVVAGVTSPELSF